MYGMDSARAQSRAPRETIVTASFYEHGKTMANGDSLDTSDPVSVATIMPRGTVICMRNLSRTRAQLGVSRDYGPAQWVRDHYGKDRLLDLTPAGKKSLGMGDLGKIIVEVLGRIPDKRADEADNLPQYEPRCQPQQIETAEVK